MKQVNSKVIADLLREGYEKINKRYNEKILDSIREEAMRKLNSPQRNLFHFIELQTHEVCKKIQLNFGRKVRPADLKDWLLSIKDISDEIQNLYDELSISFLYQPIDKIIYSLTTMAYFLYGEPEDFRAQSYSKKHLDNKSQKNICPHCQGTSVADVPETSKTINKRKVNKMGGISLFNENYRRKIQFQSQKMQQLDLHKRNIMDHIHSKVHQSNFMGISNDNKISSQNLSQSRKELLNILQQNKHTKSQIYDFQLLKNASLVDDEEIGLKNVIQSYKEEKLQILKRVQIFFHKGMSILDQRKKQLQRKASENESIIKQYEKKFSLKNTAQNFGVQVENTQSKEIFQQNMRKKQQQITTLKQLNDFLTHSIKEKNSAFLSIQNALQDSICAENVLKQRIQRLSIQYDKLKDKIERKKSKKSLHSSRKIIYLSSKKLLQQTIIGKQKKRIEKKASIDHDLSSEQKAELLKKKGSQKQNFIKKVHFKLKKKDKQKKSFIGFRQNQKIATTIKTKSERFLPRNIQKTSESSSEKNHQRDSDCEVEDTVTYRTFSKDRLSIKKKKETFSNLKKSLKNKQERKKQQKNNQQNNKQNNKYKNMKISCSYNLSFQEQRKSEQKIVNKKAEKAKKAKVSVIQKKEPILDLTKKNKPPNNESKKSESKIIQQENRSKRKIFHSSHTQKQSTKKFSKIIKGKRKLSSCMEEENYETKTNKQKQRQSQDQVDCSLQRLTQKKQCNHSHHESKPVFSRNFNKKNKIPLHINILTNDRHLCFQSLNLTSGMTEHKRKDLYN